MIDNLTFENKKRIAQEQESVRIRSKEHLHYYAVFRSYFPPPKEEGKDDDSCTSRCSDCRGCVAPDTRFCRKCGAFPVVPLSLWILTRLFCKNSLAAITTKVVRLTMMLMANCKFLMHFNTANRINNGHDYYAKTMRIYCLPRAMMRYYFLKHKVLWHLIKAKLCTWTRDKVGCPGDRSSFPLLI